MADAGEPRGNLDVLDAGCGTGLCGPLLRPYARHLVGVDLSTGVLAKARGRGVYDELVAAELTAYLRLHLRTFDLILSADTLVYFGDLGPVLDAAVAALRVPGRLVVSLERADPEEATPALGYRLDPHGRYSHTEAYLRERLAATGFVVGSIDTAVLRQEGGSPVSGYVVTARKR